MWRHVGSRAVPATRLAAALTVAGVAPAAAHGASTGPPDASTLLTGWSFDVEVWLPVILAAWGYLVLVRSVDRAHPANRVPRRRVWCWMAGLGVLILATQSPIGAYDTTLFTVHMAQHLLLTMVAAPLLLLGAPVTVLLRAASPEVRQDVILPVLHSRVVRFLSHPIVAWTQFAVVMWASHFSGLFDAALEDPLVHVLEHGLFLASALLFWWPVVGVDPAPRRLSHPLRIGYLIVGMPFSSFLGLAIFSATNVLYQHYATLSRDWGQPPLEDQQWAGGIMWAGGDLVFFLAVVLAVGAWLRAEEAEGRRIDSVLDRERAASAARAATGPDRAGSASARGPERVERPTP
jgi:putative copper resistance protein D